MRDQLMPLATDKLFIPEVGAENWLSTSKKSFFLTQRDIDKLEKAYIRRYRSVNHFTRDS